jgi:hypothetical protein
MRKRARITAFGSAGLLVLAGAVCGAAVRHELGEILALVLISLGLVLATSLIFLEIGLSEDRDRARQRAREGANREGPRERPRRPRLDRMRGRPRRLK